MVVLSMSVWLMDRQMRAATAVNLNVLDKNVLLFKGWDLSDLTGSASKMLDRLDLTSDSGKELVRKLDHHFPNFENTFHSALKKEEGFRKPDNSKFEIEMWDEFIKVVFTETATQNLPDQFSIIEMEKDIELLNGMAQHSPDPVWLIDKTGLTSWANQAYLDLINKTDTDDSDLRWPIKHIFSDVTNKQNQSIQIGDHGEHWFDVTSTKIDQGTLCFAHDTTDMVRANAAKSEFLQTLTKTFASLSTGLAVFDKDRELILFNPALNDLIALPFEFLSTRPSLSAFLDRLRIDGILPEPKDYTSWRDQITKLENEAQTGTYIENWVVPDGRTFHVTGRPHPNGAIAFLFEDISAELSLTRRFNQDIEIAHQVINSCDDAMAVFSPSGNLAFCNESYETFCGANVKNSLEDITIFTATRQWQYLMQPSPIWSDIREFVSNADERAEWDGDVQHKNGQKYLCEISPLNGGSTLIKFSHRSAALSLNRQEFFHRAG